MGYVLPRADGLISGGEVVQRVDQTNFKKYTDTIYLPSNTDKLEVGNGRNHWRYGLSDIHMVNEPIPEEDFVVIVPEGTRVVDSRDRQNRVEFDLDEKTVVNVNDDLEKKSAELRAKKGRPF